MNQKPIRKRALICALLTATIGSTAHAATERTSQHPWIKHAIGPDHQDIWNQSTGVHITDINGDGNPDIVRQTPWDPSLAALNAISLAASVVVSGEATTFQISPDPVTVFINKDREKNREWRKLPGQGEYMDNGIAYRANKVDFEQTRFTWFHNSQFFDGNLTNLYFLKNKDFAGDSMMRMEKGSWASDDNLTAQLFGNYTNFRNNSGHWQGFCNRKELDPHLNGKNGVNVYIGDFNNDGYDDVFRQEFNKSGYANDNILTANIYYGGGQVTADEHCGLSLTDDKLGFKNNGQKQNINVTGDSQYADVNPQIVFHHEPSHVLIGDFNGDGHDDIFRFDREHEFSHHSDNLTTDNGHQQAGIWFGMPNTSATFFRSNLYKDSDNNYNYSSSDEQINRQLIETDIDKVRIGDFNSDGADDILYFNGRDIVVLLSRAIRVTEDRYRGTIIDRRNIGLFEEVTIPDVANVNLDDAESTVRVADFNNDGWDDLLIWNGEPRILYSRLPKQESEGGSLTFTTVRYTQHTRDLDSQFGQLRNFTQTENRETRHLKIADFNSDGYPDILRISTAGHADLFLAPPTDPLEEPIAPNLSDVERMEGVTYRSSNLVFFQQDGRLKYMARDGAGWHAPEEVPFYQRNSDPRCTNDKPDDGHFLSVSLFAGGESRIDNDKDYYIKAICDGQYRGGDFDLVSDDEFIYLFRAEGNRVLLDRFIYNTDSSQLNRVVEARYKSTGQRYRPPFNVSPATSSSAHNTTGNSAAIDIRDNFNNWFFEPAYKVPFVATRNNAPCTLSAVTATGIADEVSGYRFIIASACENSNEAQIASIRKGSGEPFDVKAFSYEEDGETLTLEGISLWKAQMGAVSIEHLDSLSYASSITENGDPEVTLDNEYVLAMTISAPNEGTSGVTHHYPMSRFGNPVTDAASPRRQYMATPTALGTTVLSKARLHYSNDGLVHMYWKGRNASDTGNELHEAVMDTTVTDHNGQLIGAWNHSRAIHDEVVKTSWPHYAYSFLARGRYWSGYPPWTVSMGPIYTVPYSTFMSYNVNGAPLLTPVIFEYGNLVFRNGDISGVLKRTFVDRAAISPTQEQFTTYQQELLELEAQYAGRVSRNLEMVGYIEGAPPVPRENLGRDQDNKWVTADRLLLLI